MTKKWYEVFRKDRQLCEYIDEIYVREDFETIFKQIIKKRIRLLGVAVTVVIAAWLFCFMRPGKESLLNDHELTRQKEDTEINLRVSASAKEQKWQHELPIEVKAKQFTEEEKGKLTVRVRKYLTQRIKGKNISLKQVERELCLPENIPDTGIAVNWTVDENYISDKGNLVYTSLPQGGTDTELMAKAEWKNWKDTFYFTVHLVGRHLPETEKQLQQVKEVLKKTMSEQKEKSKIILPAQIGNMNMTYTLEGEEKSYMPVYFLLLLLFLLPFVWKQQQRKEQQRREEQLLTEHSGMVNKFMLLLGAGLTVRKVVERLTEEYTRERNKGGKKRYVYEELCVLARELKDGVSESKALEHFGRRCKLLPYLRFVSVMTQNLKKGAEGILKILEKESLEAMEQRKERALQLGEMAGTKLLFPMMLMLGIVMAVIMVPAFMTM